MTPAERNALRLMVHDKLRMYPWQLLSEHWGKGVSSFKVAARKAMLRRMVEKGWVEALNPGGYRITEAGVLAFSEELTRAS